MLCHGLFGVGESVDLEFEGLGVLALDVELGLEFFNEQLETGDFTTQLMDVGGAGRWTSRRLRALGGLAGVKTAASHLGRGRFWRERLG